MSTLYVVEPGARLEKEYQRLLVVKDDEILLRVSIQRITQVILVGRVGVTTPALHQLLNKKIPLLLVSKTGRLSGRLLPPTRPNLPLRQAQYQRNDDIDFCLSFVRQLVAGKIRNQRVLAQRLARQRDLEDEGEVLEELKNLVARARIANSLPTLLGIEGQGAKTYFSLYKQAFSPHWAFQKRTRRPPKDPVNALLSLGYTFLGYAMITALEAVGLDPYLGFFHTEKYGRPALALDLLEEFRAPVVDSLVLTLLRRNTLQKKDFQPPQKNGAIYLKPDALRIFFAKFSKKLEQPIKLRNIQRPLSYRKIFEVQARKIAHYVQGDTDHYAPFQAR